MTSSRLLFVHDHRFCEDGVGNVYSNGGLPRAVWQRYLAVFSRLTVLGRKASQGCTEQSVGSLALSSCPGVSFVLVPSISSLSAKVLGSPRVQETVAEQVSAHDAIIARLPSELGLLAITEARKQGKPYAIELVECPWDALWHYGRLHAKFYAPIMALRTRRALKRSPFSLYVTSSFLQRRYPSPRAERIACSNVHIPQLSKAVLERRRRRIVERREPIRIGLIGSLAGRMKGVEVALRALGRIKDDLGAFEFHLLGGGDPSRLVPLINRLRLDGHVHFDGVVPSGSAVCDWLDGIDLYLQPSFKEGLPRALIEAMSRGCPALGTRVAGIPELLDHRELVKAGDYKALAEKILNVCSCIDLQRSMAERNFRIAARYEAPLLDVIRQRYLELFREYAFSMVRNE